MSDWKEELAEYLTKKEWKNYDSVEQTDYYIGGVNFNNIQDVWLIGDYFYFVFKEKGLRYIQNRYNEDDYIFEEPCDCRIPTLLDKKAFNLLWKERK